MYHVPPPSGAQQSHGPVPGSVLAVHDSSRAPGGKAPPPSRLAREPSWAVPQHPTGARQARQMTRQQLRDWKLTEQSEVAELLVSELITNALTHGRSPIRLRLKTWHGTLRCEVTDHQAALPQARPLSPDSEAGRGMHLVDLLSERWGVQSKAYCKTVWFELATCTTLGCCP